MLVAVARVLNEDDIIEAFVRHTLAFADRMIVLDNGSVDRTLEILHALRVEGAPLVVLQSRSVVFNEEPVNTMLYHTADRAFQPHWVLCLDADEFIDARGVDVRACLAAVPAEVQAVQVPLRNYFAEGLASAELLVPRRMVMRDMADRGVVKCFVRGQLADVVTVEAGNHGARVGANAAITIPLALPLAHFPERHPIQGITKAVIGRLKVLATGGGEAVLAQTSHHYTNFLDIMCRNPAELLGNSAYMAAALPAIPLVEDPIHYAGAPLRYTIPPDPVMKSIKCLAHAAERLARAHGTLLDGDPAIRRQVEAAAMQTELLAPQSDAPIT